MNTWLNYLKQQKIELEQKKETILNNIDNEINSINIQLEQGLNGIKIQDVIDRFDLDGDNFISLIDINLALLIILNNNIAIHDPLYDAATNTYNGKSIDFNNDNVSNISDLVLFINSMLNLPFAMTWEYLDRNNDVQEFMIQYYNENSKWPTWQEVKQHFEQ